MKGTEKQIKWAEDIIAEHKEVSSLKPKWADIVSEFDLDWDNADASKIIDMSGWAAREKDLGFGQKRNAKFNSTKFYNMLAVVFGIKA